jgi:hypothetical protein
MYQTYIKVVIGTAAIAADSENAQKKIYQGCAFSFNVCDTGLMYIFNHYIC